MASVPIDYPRALTDYSCIYAWALDFVRAMIERPLWVRILLRVLMGKYAYREFIGMMNELSRQGDYLWEIGYGLEGQEYHNDSVPFDFGKYREGRVLKQHESD